jgi:polar amino acid transport system substrate-binding protein
LVFTEYNEPFWCRVFPHFKSSHKSVMTMYKSFLICFCSVLLGSDAFAQQLTILCEDDKTLQFRTADGKPAGFAVELVQELQKRVGNKDEIQAVPWARGLAMLNKMPNTLLFSMARTAERNAQYQWIGPIFENVYGFYIKADSPIKINSLDDAKKAGVIGVYRDDVRDQTLTRLGFTNLDRSNDNVATFRKLMVGRFAMIVSSKAGVSSQAQSAGYRASDVKLAYTLLKTQLYVAASKETDPAVVARWNMALNGMKKDHTFSKILKKYYPDVPLPGPAITQF